MPSEEDLQQWRRDAKRALGELEDTVAMLREEVEDNPEAVPPRALHIIKGATETLHALGMGGWPWWDSTLRAISNRVEDSP